MEFVAIEMIVNLPLLLLLSRHLRFQKFCLRRRPTNEEEEEEIMSHHLPILLRLSSKSLVLNNGREERPTVFLGGRRLLCQYVRGPKKKEPSAVNGFSDYSRKMRYRCFPLFFSPMSSFFLQTKHTIPSGKRWEGRWVHVPRKKRGGRTCAAAGEEVGR